MANPEHVKIVKRGADEIRAWRAKNAFARLDLANANLRGADLHKAHLHNADLHLADLRKGVLIHAELSDSDLSGAVLCEAFLVAARLVKINLCRANLCSASLLAANLNQAVLRNAILREVDLSGAHLIAVDMRDGDLNAARIGGTTFAEVDLSNARGLDTITHFGPSSIGVDTLVYSKGRIPDVFLRGCGFSPWQILEAKLYDPDLTPGQIADLQTQIFNLRTDEYPWVGGVFISYAREDSAAVDKIRDRLDVAGFPTWLDRHDMTAGPVEKQIQRAVRTHDIVLLALSEASVKSDWVEHELEMARDKEVNEGRNVLCPIALDDAWEEKVLHNPDVLWRQVKKKNVLDFSKWKTKAFDPTFQKLLTGLKAWYPRRTPAPTEE